MQTPAWGDVKRDFDKCLCGIYKDGTLSGCAMLLIKKFPFGAKYIYSPRGFAIDYNDIELLKEFVKGIRGYAISQKAYTVKIDPNILRHKLDKNGLVVEGGFNNEHIINNLTSLGFVHGGFSLNTNDYIQPRFNMCVSLVDEDNVPLSDEKLLGSFDRKARKYVGRYVKDRGYSFEIFETPEQIGELARLVDVTAKRHSIILRNENYFKNMFSSFSKTNDISLYFAKLNFDKLLEYVQNGKNNISNEDKKSR